MHHRFWEDAVATTCYPQNRSPHRALQGAIPFTLWYEQSPNVSHLKVFGAITYTYIQSKNRSKLENHCTKGRFIGYGNLYRVNAYRIYLPQSGKIVFSQSIKFDEEFVICGQVGRSETSSLEGTLCDIFQHMAATREK